MLLEINNIGVSYDKAVALRDISLTVDEGEIVTIIGRNGAGKSTILKAISGIVKINKGEIRFRGEMINKASIQSIVAKGIAHAPEGRRVFSDLTVFENLKIGSYTRKDKNIDTDYDWIFELFPRLEERRNQFAGSLSGGEQQMLTIGRALMSRPSLLLLDEPSMGLSPIMVKEIAGIVRAINKHKGLSIVLVEQNSDLALHISHRGYLLETGLISQSGMTDDLLHDDYIQEAYLG